MKKAIAFVLVLALLTGASRSGLFALSNIDWESVGKKETPIADLSNDRYEPYDYDGSYANNIALHNIEDEIANVGGYTETYASEEEYKAAQNKRSERIADSFADADFSAVMETIIVMTTPTGSKEIGNYKPSVPIADALVRLDGVPRYTDHKGRVTAPLLRDYVELYVERNGYNPYIEIIEADGNDKTVYLKQPSDDIEITYAMYTMEGETGNLLLQEFYVTESEDTRYSRLTIGCNVEPDNYILYADEAIIETQNNSVFDDIEYNDYMRIGSELYIQVVYLGIVSKKVKLNLVITAAVSDDEILAFNEGGININIDGGDTNKAFANAPQSKSGEIDTSKTPSFFGAFEFDLQDALKSLCNISESSNHLPVFNASYDRRDGTLKVLIGYEYERTTDIQNTKRLREELDRLEKEHEEIINNPHHTEAEKEKNNAKRWDIKYRLEDEEKRDSKNFNNVYHSVKKFLEDKKNNDLSAKDTRKLFDQIKNIKNIKKRPSGKPSLTNAPKFKFEFEVVGAFEYNLREGRFEEISIEGGVDFTFQFGGQFLIGWLPCFWRIDVGFGFKLDITLLATEDGKTGFSLADLLTFSVLVHAKGTLGAGFYELASIHGYVGLDFEFMFHFINKENPMEGTVALKAGVGVRLLLWEFNWDIFDKKWPLYGGKKEAAALAQLSARTTLGDYLSEYSLSANSYVVYAPEIARIGDKTVMVWVEDNPSQDDYNRTRIMYSIKYDAADNWSTPSALSVNNEKSEFYPKLYSNGSKLYLTWQRSNRIFDGSDDVVSMATAGEIYFAEFDYAGNTFVATTALTNNCDMDTQPSFVVSDDEKAPVSVYWRKNSENDVFGMSGRNDIAIRSLVNGVWSTETTLFSSENLISYPQIAYANGNFVIAYTEDCDGDPMSQENEIFIKRDKVTTKLSNTAGKYSSLKFMRNGDQTMLLFAEEGRIYNSFDFTSYRLIVDTEQAENQSGYDMISDGENFAILYKRQTENGQQIYASVYNRDEKTWSNNIRLTDEGVGIFNYNAIFNPDGSIKATYNCGPNETQSQLCVLDKTLKYDFLIENAYIAEIPQNNKTFPLSIELFNSGTFDIRRLSAEILNKVYPIELEFPLKVGERRYVTINVLAADIETYCKVDICIFAKGAKDRLIAKAQYTIAVDFADAAVTLSRRVTRNGNVFDIAVENYSFKAIKAKLFIQLNNEEISVYELTLDIGGHVVFNDLIFDANIGDKIKVVLSVEGTDLDLSNNIVHSSITAKSEVENARPINPYSDPLLFGKEFMV